VGASISPGGSPRRVLLIPVLHTAQDLGELGSAVRARKLAQFGLDAVLRSEDAIAHSWAAIEAFVLSLPSSLEGYRVYQDGLPVCGRELEIVTELASKGSRNHALLLRLHERGARIMGTESPGLLLEELAGARRAAAGGPAPPAADGGGGEGKGEGEGEGLLERRDRSIAERIGKTLLPGETGILFIGAIHGTATYLPGDVVVETPLGGRGR